MSASLSDTSPTRFGWLIAIVRSPSPILAGLALGALLVLIGIGMGAALAAKGQALEVANENAGVRRALEVAGLSGRFPVRGGQG